MIIRKDRISNIFVAAVAATTIALAGCSGSAGSAALTAVAASAQGPVTTLLGLAAANSTTVADLVTKGQVFCNTSLIAPDADAVALSGIATALGVPYASVINQVAGDVAQACAAIGMVPVPQPATVALASVPVVATPAAAVLAPKV